MLLPTGLLHHGQTVKAQVPSQVIDSLRCGGALDGQLCEDRALDGSVSEKSVQALREGKSRMDGKRKTPGTIGGCSVGRAEHPSLKDSFGILQTDEAAIQTNTTTAR